MMCWSLDYRSAALSGPILETIRRVDNVNYSSDKNTKRIRSIMVMVRSRVKT